MNKKITAIEVQKNNKDKVNVFIDNDCAFSCHSEIVYKEGLKIGKCIEDHKLLDIAHKEEFTKAKSLSLKALERGLKTEEQIKKKLKDKGYEEEVIEKAIAFLKNYDFLDDNRYAKLYIKDKIKANGESKIRYELIKKGICKNIIDKAFLDIEKSTIDEAVRKVALKKYNSIRKNNIEEKKMKEKLFRYLVGKGYDFSNANKAIKEIFENFKEY